MDWPEPQNNPRPEIRDALYKLRFQRFLSSRDLPEAPKGYCKWCGSPLSGRARRWCSDECRREFEVRNGAADYYVFQRDKGVCAHCGMDCVWLKRELSRIRRARGLFWHTAVKDWGFWPRTNRRCWEADHIVPVCEGGGCCGLENYQSLCLKCHKEETKDLARRRSLAKTGQMALFE